MGSKRVKIKSGYGPDYSREEKILEAEQATACDQFNNVDHVAEKFVTNLLDVDLEVEDNVERRSESEETSEDMTLVELWRTGNFKCWPTIEKFSARKGKLVIEEYIATMWVCKEPWVHSIQLILIQSDEASEFYIYESRWSLPTKTHPIPQVATSIFFTIEVSRVKPPFCLVDVTYRFEGGACIYYPFEQAFDESKLLDNLEAKLKFFKSLTF